MKKVKIKHEGLNMSLNVPESSEDISIKDAQDIIKIMTELQVKKDEKLTNKEILHRNLTLISKFYKLSVTELMAIEVDVINTLVEGLNNALLLPEQVTLTPILKIEGKSYGIEPDFEKLSLGEFTDLSDFINDYESYHRAMAVMYREIDSVDNFKSKPVNFKYTIKPYKGLEGRDELMLDVPYIKYRELAFFLLSSQITLLDLTQKYLQEEAKEMNLEIPSTQTAST